MKGYHVGYGYMGYVDDGYILFTSEAEYMDYIAYQIISLQWKSMQAFVFISCYNQKGKCIYMDIRTREDVLLVLEQHWKWLENPKVGAQAKFDNVDFEKMEINFSEMDLRKVYFRECKFYEINFIKANLSESQFISCNLSSANFENANMSRVTLQRCRCDETRFMKANLDAALLLNQHFKICDFRQTNFGNICLRYSWFERCNCAESQMEIGCALLTQMTQCNLTNAVYHLDCTHGYMEITFADCILHGFVKTITIKY